MKPDRTRNTRAAKYRAATKADGGAQINVRIGPEAAAALAAFRPHMTVREILEIALVKLAVDEYNHRRANPPAPAAPPASTSAPAD